MAKEKLVKNITPRDENFAQWYTDVVREANLCDYSSVKGCLNYLPNGYAIWELIQADLDRRFKETGVENVYLPVLIPESLLEKEADHVEGFAPEVAWVTHGGMERLQERMCIRPTSETLFCDLWAKTVRSYRDLPKVWNQWNSVLRWEKTTRPFLRSREFLWQEGHTLHATYEEAEARTIQMWEVYKDCYRETMAIPFVAGRKAENEKFAGAQDTYTIEALMHDGKALQSATSHFFGSGFPDAHHKTLGHAAAGAKGHQHALARHQLHTQINQKTDCQGMSKSGIGKVLPVLFGFFVMGFCDVAGIATSYVKQDFGLSETMAGFIPSMVFIWFLLLSIPAAVWMNRIGRKTMVLLSNLLFA